MSNEHEKTKVYKIEVMVVDHDGIGEEGVRSAIENTRYPNRCIMPQVMGVEEKTIYWRDDHPLNMTATADATYQKLFERSPRFRALQMAHGLGVETPEGVVQIHEGDWILVEGDGKPGKASLVEEEEPPSFAELAADAEMETGCAPEDAIQMGIEHLIDSAKG